jgi:phage-related protein
MFEVEFYSDRRGNEPVKEFLIELREKGKTSKTDRIRAEKILTCIRLLQAYGTRAGEPFMKHICNGLWELRPMSDRVFFFYFGDKTFVLLHHFVKKTKKTPKREIDKARRNMADHIERS